MTRPDQIYAAYNAETLAPRGLNARHIADNLKYYEAARSGFFTLIVSDLDGITTGSGTKDRTFDHAQEYLELNITKASVPKFTVEKLEYSRGNEKVYFAGVPTWEEGSITVDDVVGLDTKGILYAWKNKAFDPKTGKGGRMTEYKKTCTLIEYTQDYEQIRSWTLYGCWISAIEDSDFDREQDDKRQLTATIIYDRAEMSYETVEVEPQESSSENA